MTTPTTDEELAKLREAVANDMADAVVPGLLARLDQAEQRVRELEQTNAMLREGHALKAEDAEHYQAEAVAQARRDALREAADEARRRGGVAARIRHGTPTDGWLHDFANWLESRMAEENACLKPNDS